MIGRVRESRNSKKVIRVTLMESYGEIGRVPVNLFRINLREEPLFAFRLQVVQNVNSYKVDKNAESAKMSHEALTTSVMRVTM